MPREPKSQKRRADVVGNAVQVTRIKKDPAAVSLGRRGGKARAEALSQERRKEIARQAAEKRWSADHRESQRRLNEKAAKKEIKGKGNAAGFACHGREIANDENARLKCR